LKIKVQKLDPDAIIPKYAKPDDAGFDLSAIDEGFLLPMERILIGTGLVFEIPEGYEMQIRSRSGLAAKHGIAVLNAPGTVDAGYRGEVKVILINLGYEPFEIKKGDRIAQGVVKPVEQVEFELAEKLSETERGGNGFGSTGV
jgi:dUTP pyrophosphatase